MVFGEPAHEGDGEDEGARPGDQVSRAAAKPPQSASEGAPSVREAALPAAVITRRRLLGYLSGLLSAAIAAALGLPLARLYVGNAFKPRAARWLRLGPAASVHPNQPALFTVSYVDQDGWRENTARQEVYAVTQNGKDFVVFSNVCTHLGCPIHWDDTRAAFICPCHGGVFGMNGQVLHGPPPRPLTQVRYRMENGDIYVQVGEV